MGIILSPIRLLSVLPIIPAVGKDREQTVLFDITCDIIVSNLKRFEAKRLKFILENICRLFAQQMMRWKVMRPYNTGRQLWCDDVLIQSTIKHKVVLVLENIEFCINKSHISESITHVNQLGLNYLTILYLGGTSHVSKFTINEYD